jgi:fructosamine-3-kinase
MARMRGIAERVEQLLARAVVATTPVAGGDVCTSTRVRLSDGTSALVKTRAGAPDDFFAAEARGLAWLAEPGVAEVAKVLAVERDCLVLGWIEPARASPESSAALGRSLARLHASGAERFGAAQDGYIGSLPLPNRTAPSWAEFFATRRVLPYLKLASDRGHIAGQDVSAVEALIGRMTTLAGPEEPPARIHGDLWSGNVVWSLEHGTLIDPAAHGGHRETDLAMLALFGLPHLQRLMDAYEDEHPLADGWEERQPLHQLFPLLVHAAMFGGHYGQRAGEAARRLQAGS